MKNRCFYSSLLAGFAAIFLTNCSFFQVTESTKLACPDLTKSGSGIVVSLKNSINDIEYVNIYRQDISDVTGTSDENTSSNPIENIGIIFAVNDNTTFVYEDTSLYKGNKYRYYARICDKTDGYSQTEWTKGFTAENGLTNDYTSSGFKYSVLDGTKFIFHSTEKTLEIKGTINPPTKIADFDENYIPALIVTNTGTKATQTFELESIENGTIINLSGLLPLDFFNTDIKISGLVGQKTERVASATDSSVKIIQKIIWTEPSDIVLYDSDGEKITDNQIILNEEHGENGFDYSM